MKLDKQISELKNKFNNLNEIQKITGRGEGGALDTLLTASEDFVDFLNTPNRWQ